MQDYYDVFIWFQVSEFKGRTPFSECETSGVDF